MDEELGGEQTSVSMAKEKNVLQNIRKRIGQRVIFGESRYMKRNGLDGRREWRW